MTDKEMVIYLCKKLNLEEKLDYVKHDYPGLGSNGYNISLTKIFIGSGFGYGDFFTEFEFDDEGNITGHGVWE